MTEQPTVSEVMSPSPISVDLDDLPSKVFHLLRNKAFRHLPVLDGSLLVGVISALDLERASLRRWVSDGEDDAVRLDSQYSVADLMTADPVYVRADDPLHVAGQRLSSGAFHCLPVLDGSDALVGMLTTTDLARWIASGAPVAPAGGDPRLVSSWMTRDLRHFTPSTTVGEARARSGVFRHLPLVTDKLTGFLHRSQLTGVPDEVLLGDLAPRPAISMVPDTPVLTAISRLRAASEDVVWIVGAGVLGAFTEHDACRYAVQELAGSGLRVQRLASPAPETIRAEASAKQASQKMLHRWIRHLPVLQNDVLVGVLSWRDLQGVDDDTPVSTLISPLMHTVEWETPMEIAAQRMVKGHIGALPVVNEHGLLEAIITRVDVMRALLDPLELNAAS